VVLSALDPTHPVSSSATVVQGVIRGDWGHQGVLITDDLTMAAAYNRGLCEVTIDALNAGVDLLLLAYDYEKFYPSMYCALQAAADGRIDLAELGRSDDRLAQLSPRVRFR
jgi:beta-N-acetylhexosaminidase